MRCVHNPQSCLGQTPIPDIQIDSHSRDDIPAVLKGLQHLYCDEKRREQVFQLLERHLLRPNGIRIYRWREVSTAESSKALITQTLRTRCNFVCECP